jgi:hypothetical protein
MWLAKAKDSAKDSAELPWINRLYDSAMQQATEDEKALAAMYLKRLMATQRE